MELVFPGSDGELGLHVSFPRVCVVVTSCKAFLLRASGSLRGWHCPVSVSWNSTQAPFGQGGGPAR